VEYTGRRENDFTGLSDNAIHRSDTHGRKLTLQISLVSTMLGVLVFGLTLNFWLAQPRAAESFVHSAL
jgi:hypothetical protein